MQIDTPHMNQQHQERGPQRSSEGHGRQSEYLSGDFWSVLRFEEDIDIPGRNGSRDTSSTDDDTDESGSGDSEISERNLDKETPVDCAIRDSQPIQQTLQAPLREMQQVGPTSPLIFPVLGLEDYVLTPATATRNVPNPATGKIDYFITIKSPGLRLPPIVVSSPLQQLKSSRHVQKSKERPHAPAAVQNPKYSAPIPPRQTPPMLGPKSRPALPSLTSAPVVPSWRRRAASTSKATSRRPMQDYDNPRPVIVKSGDEFNSELLDSLVDSAWSEPSTPITPIEMGGCTPFIPDAEGGFRLDRSMRGDLSARRDSCRTELQSVVRNEPLSGGLKSAGARVDAGVSAETMPHRKPQTPVSILKPSRYPPPEPKEWF